MKTPKKIPFKLAVMFANSGLKNLERLKSDGHEYDSGDMWDALERDAAEFLLANEKFKKIEIFDLVSDFMMRSR